MVKSHNENKNARIKQTFYNAMMSSKQLKLHVVSYAAFSLIKFVSSDCIWTYGEFAALRLSKNIFINLMPKTCVSGAPV